MGFEIHQIDENVSVAPQLGANDMQDVADAGFKTVIINRPDFEGGPDQPASGDVIAAAKLAGLTVHYLPVVGNKLTVDDAQNFKALLAQSPQPILAYCRTGTRCHNLYLLAQQV